MSKWNGIPKHKQGICVCSPLKSGSIVELHYSRFLLLACSLDWMGKRCEGKRYNYFVSDNSDGNKRGEMEK